MNQPTGRLKRPFELDGYSWKDGYSWMGNVQNGWESTTITTTTTNVTSGTLKF